MTIDRNDENTTRDEQPEVSLDKQIEIMNSQFCAAIQEGSAIQESILASLQRLDKIDKVKAPEPVAWLHRSMTHPQYDAGIYTDKRDGWETIPLYGPEVIDLLRRETVRADRNGRMSQGNYELYKRTVADLTKAEAELDALKKDAERYRWLREEWSNRKWRHVPVGNGVEADDITKPDEIDAAIDAAIEDDCVMSAVLLRKEK